MINTIMSDNNNDLDYFELKYLEEISDLFNQFKGMDNYYQLNLFNKDFTDFYDFIEKNIVIYQYSENDNELTSDEEIYE
tara:strand:+ start:1051 stop:1287 length:237 start_codon:yes stop_codon:yes gene_type:complete